MSLALAILVVPRGQIVDPVARRIVASVERTYLSMKTFEDCGTAVRRGINVSYTLRYKSEGKLFVEIRAKGKEGNHRYILWSLGKPQKFWIFGVDGPGHEEESFWTNTWFGFDNTLETNLPMGEQIAGFSGIIQCSAWRLLQLLLPRITGLANLGFDRDLAYLRTEPVQGIPCFVIASKKGRETLWVDKKTFLLRKDVWRGLDFPQTTLFQPTRDIPLDDSAFDFHPPKDARVVRNGQH